MSPPLPIADAHNDLLLACLHRRERGVRDPFGDDWLPGLQAGGIVFQVLPIFTEDQFVGEGALRRTLELLELAHEIATVHRHDVALVQTAEDLGSALESGRIALVLALEGSEPLGSSPVLIETMWRLGVRLASLTWNRRTMMADGIAETDTGGRLTSLGVEAIAEMNRLGMIVDISHLSAPGVAHLASINSRPFMASHSSCRALCDHPRNLTDGQIEAVISSGGFVGINAFAPFIARPNATIDGVIDHLEYAATVGGFGAGHAIGLGADFIYDLVRLVDPILSRQLLVHLDDIDFIEDFKGPADYSRFSARLLERLDVATARRYASENMLAFFRAQLPKATA